MKRLLVLSILLLLAACSNDSNKKESSKNVMIPDKIIEVPQTRQAKSYTCGVAAAQSILYYYGNEYRQDVLEEMLKANENDGTNYRNIIKILNEHDIETNLKEKMTLDDLKKNIEENKITLIFIQAWNDDKNFDYSNGWEDGHYVLAIGYDKDRFYFMDPSTISNYTYIDNDALLKRWHDYDSAQKYYQTGITIYSDKITYNKNAYLSLD